MHWMRVGVALTLAVATRGVTAQQCNVSTGVVIGSGSIHSLNTKDANACCDACFAFGSVLYHAVRRVCACV